MARRGCAAQQARARVLTRDPSTAPSVAGLAARARALGQRTERRAAELRAEAAAAEAAAAAAAAEAVAASAACAAAWCNALHRPEGWQLT